MFCGIKYAHPGAHRGFGDVDNNVSWLKTFKNKWWIFRDIPVIIRNPLAHAIRCWWWLATGTNLKVWAAIHRHNSIHEHKIWPNGKTNAGRFTRSLMYLSLIKNKKITDLYGDETPDTWIDRNVYHRAPLLGPIILFALEFMLLGFWCLIPWLAQMAWLPFWRSESVNGWDPKDHEWNRLFHKIKDKEFCL